MVTIIRQAYIDKIEKYLGKETIIVLVGQRRVGKSYMMKTVRDQKASNPDNNIIYIDKEKREFDSIRNYQDLNQYIDEHFVPANTTIFSSTRYKTSRSLSEASEVSVPNQTPTSSSLVAMPRC